MEGLSFEDVAAFSQTWGVVYFLVMFLAALAYVLWPANHAGFREAARIPLRDDGEP